MRVCLMIEGQEDVSWEQWRALANAAERNGFEALFRSDHYVSVQGVRERGSLDAWATLAALAACTSTIRLGTLVSPATFRHPSVLAKSVVTVDHVSGGRAELGIGAGWYEREHREYGFPFALTRERLDVLEEQLEIVTREWAPEPFSFAGRHYRLEDVDARPKPVQNPRPSLIVGGSGGRRSLALAARFADEYNTIFAGPERCRDVRQRLTAACNDARREPLPLSLMTGVLVGADRADLERRALELARSGGENDADGAAALAALPDSWLVGTPAEVVERLGRLERAGVSRVMLQSLLHWDLDALELIGREVIPAV